MTRDEHLAWCKQRALAYVDRGELVQALNSMLSDLSKHPETDKHSGVMLGVMLSAGGHLNTPEAMREFIEGFR